MDVRRLDDIGRYWHGFESRSQWRCSGVLAENGRNGLNDTEFRTLYTLMPLINISLDPHSHSATTPGQGRQLRFPTSIRSENKKKKQEPFLNRKNCNFLRTYERTMSMMEKQRSPNNKFSPSDEWTLMQDPIWVTVSQWNEKNEQHLSAEGEPRSLQKCLSVLLLNNLLGKHNWIRCQCVVPFSHALSWQRVEQIENGAGQFNSAHWACKNGYMAHKPKNRIFIKMKKLVRLRMVI